MRVNDRTDTPSLTASFNSAAFHLSHLEGYAITFAAVETVATLAGSVKLQASNNAFTGNVGNSTFENASATWVDVPSSTQSVASGTSIMWNVTGAYYRDVRLVYTATTGQGTATVIWHAKGPQS